MKLSRIQFLALAGAGALTSLSAKKLKAATPLGNLDAELDRVLPFPLDYGREYNQAKIKAYHLHNQPMTSPLHKGISALWQDVFEKTNGELLVTVVPRDASMPAGDPQAVRLVVEGRFEIVSVAGPIIDKLAPQAISAQNFCFIYQSPQEVYGIINRPEFTQALNRAVSKYNLTFLSHGTFDNGMRVVTSVAGKPLATAQDFDGLIIRIPPSNDMKVAMLALGANPKEFTMNQVFAALADRSVQAQENPLSVAMGFDLYKVTKYLNMTNHAWSGYNTFFNTKFWQSLSPAHQRVISELMPIYQAKQIKLQEDYNAMVYQELTTKLGMEVVQPQLGNVTAKLTNVYQSLYGQLDPAVQRLVQPILKARTGLTFS